MLFGFGVQRFPAALVFSHPPRTKKQTESGDESPHSKPKPLLPLAA
jgi:hypothetical protein